ncbi:hypothetical protein [Evansella tamaricis]|uniref:Uncharacterized protein n=1 Tax=Evansella tamaricis TaxID=2069301 RepID=A0ABS6JIT8_9BACI|nr:hypothetical protein [Evansella tamaricis]MBU9713448.1 hypothetical protein [Evansella tamaricis]
MDKQTYFVTFRTGSKVEIMEEEIPDRTIQYEITADKEELKNLQSMINELKEKDIFQEHILVRPFKEYRAAVDKEELQSELNDLLDCIYELGTKETKENLKAQ